MGSMHVRALRNGAVAAVVTAVAGFTLNWLVSPEETTRAAVSPTPSPRPSPTCTPRAEPPDRAAVRRLSGAFEDVWFAKPDDGWAVGSAGGATGTPSDEAADTGADEETPVLDRWDGEAWSEGSGGVDLGGSAAVAAIEGTGASDVWAVGWTSAGFGRDTLAAHFDGTTWTVTTTPGDGALTDVRVLATDDVWAVGSLGDPDVVEERATALHWDGLSWTQVPVQAGGGRSGLRAIAGTEGDLWAAGYHHLGSLLMHYDGTRWERIDLDIEGRLNAVAVADGTIWLAGSSLVRGDGSSFDQAASPPKGGSFADVAATSGDAAVAVGSVARGAHSRSIAVDVAGEDARATPVRAPGDDALEAVAPTRDGVWLAGWHEAPRGPVPLVATLRGC